MKLKSLLLVYLILTSITTFAQSQQVSGVVVDEQGLPMEMVSVYVKGTQNIVGTDADGKYSIIANSKDTLIYTFLGYRKQEIIVGKRKNINIALKHHSANSVACKSGTVVKLVQSANICAQLSSATVIAEISGAVANFVQPANILE